MYCSKPPLKIFSLTCLFLALIGYSHPSDIQAHPQDELPSIELTMTLREAYIQLDALVPYQVFSDQIVADHPHATILKQLHLMDSENQNGAFFSQAITRFFDEKSLVTIDQIKVAPTYHNLKIYRLANRGDQVDPDVPVDTEDDKETEGSQDTQNQEFDELESAKYEITVRYSVNAAFKQVGLRWGTYLPRVYPDDYQLTPDDPVADSISLMIHSKLEGSGKIKFHQLSLEEPMYIWHHFKSEISYAEQNLLAAKPYEPAYWRINLGVWLPIVIASPLSLALFFVWRRASQRQVPESEETPAPRPIRASIRIGTLSTCTLILCGISLASIIGIMPEKIWRIRQPGQPVFESPAPEQATEIFARLHANIYRAFDYTEDSVIYDTLAQSCNGPVLEQMFKAVYQSLVLSDEGGAIAKVQEVSIMESRMIETPMAERSEQLKDDKLLFTIHCRWRVKGIVRHFGHSHERTNEFEANYTLAPRKTVNQTEDAAWRIVDFHVISEKPIIEENAAPLNSTGTIQPDASFENAF